MSTNTPALAWLRTQAEGTDDNAGHARAVLAMVEGIEAAPANKAPGTVLRALTVAGEPFVCACGCNVFRLALRGAVDTYECNACWRWYDAAGPDAPAPSHQRGVLGRRP